MIEDIIDDLLDEEMDYWDCYYCCEKCYAEYGKCPYPDSCDPLDI